MKKWIIFALLFCTAFCGADAFAQSGTGRAASGEKRAIDRKSDVTAYEGMKKHVNDELSIVVERAEARIDPFNTKWLLDIRTELEQIRIALEYLENPANSHEENDPRIMTPKLADVRSEALDGTGIPVCNPQTEEIIFNNTTRRWSCVGGVTGCMASQNVWR